MDLHREPIAAIEKFEQEGKTRLGRVFAQKRGTVVARELGQRTAGPGSVDHPALIGSVIDDFPTFGEIGSVAERFAEFGQPASAPQGALQERGKSQRAEPWRRIRHEMGVRLGTFAEADGLRGRQPAVVRGRGGCYYRETGTFVNPDGPPAPAPSADPAADDPDGPCLPTHCFREMDGPQAAPFFAGRSGSPSSPRPPRNLDCAGLPMALKSDTDLFESSTMTFGQHLEELRVCLMKAMVGLVIGTVIGFFLGNKVVKLIEAPLRGALERYYVTQAETEYTKWATQQLKAGQPIPYTIQEIRAIAQGDPKKDKPELIYEIQFIHPSLMSATLHSMQSATDVPPAAAGPTATPSSTAPTPSTAALPAATPTATPSSSATSSPAADTAPAAAIPNDETIAKIIKGEENAPKRYTRENLAAHLLWHPIESDSRFNMQATGVTEPFSVWLKASLVVGVVLSSPWVFYHLWTFVASGLYSHERKYVYTYMPFSIGLFLAGAALAYLAVFEPVLDFLFDFNKDMGIDPDPKIGEWLGFVLILPLGFGISFQLPLVMLFLERIGVFSIEGYLKNWRIAVLVIFILSAILTPADPYSLLFMACPLTLLYFGGVLLAKYLPHHAPALEPVKR
jgi:sec-independent protein translocase protein TatC